VCAADGVQEDGVKRKVDEVEDARREEARALDRLSDARMLLDQEDVVAFGRKKARRLAADRTTADDKSVAHARCDARSHEIGSWPAFT
jgi:hypothetical protein